MEQAQLVRVKERLLNLIKAHQMFLKIQRIIIYQRVFQKIEKVRKLSKMLIRKIDTSFAENNKANNYVMCKIYHIN